MFQINGKQTNKISIEDRAVQYGDGVFETIAVKEKLLEFWKIEKQFIPVDVLYNKIESIVMKESQSKFKESLLENLFDEFNVIINPGFYVFGR